MQIKKSIKQEENKSNGFIIMYDWLLELPPSEAAMLSYLIDAEDICSTRDENDTDFFECTANFMMKRCIGWTQSNITTALNNLEDKNLIMIKNIRTNTGNPRYIKISRDGISALKEKYYMHKNISHN